jgi:hypothetical protein
MTWVTIFPPQSLNWGDVSSGPLGQKATDPGKSGDCFANAARLAFDNRGRYVEGFALTPEGRPIHHAWVTLDGIHAVDVTWSEWATDAQYFGIEIPAKPLARALLDRNLTGSLLDPFDRDSLVAAVGSVSGRFRSLGCC